MASITALPDELLDRIFHCLEAKDLARSSLVCRRFQTITENERHWKNLCDIDWNIAELPDGERSWKQTYAAMCNRFGRYVKCYARANRCWQKIYAVTHSRAPMIYASLVRNGATEEILDRVQQSLGEYAQLPLEYRCSYRLCNGQLLPRTLPTGDWPFAGLFGAYEEGDYGDYFCTWTPDYINNPQASWHSNPSVSHHCCLKLIWVVKRIIPSMSTHGGIALCVRDSAQSPYRIDCRRDAEHGRLDGCMVSMSMSTGCIEYFVYSNSFLEYMETFANKTALYPVINNRFLKYDFNSEGDTGPYGVTVRTAFFRERSVALPFEDREFHFFYRITMRMRPDAPKCDSCQLKTRHWVITDANGEVTRVDGLGVVGNYPVMRPGAEFTWISRTSYKTTVGTMHGHFTMQRIGSGTEFRRVSDLSMECYE